MRAGRVRRRGPPPAACAIPDGTGLYAKPAHLPDGRVLIVYYDRATGDLVAQLDTGGGLDASVGTDTGAWAALVVDGDGTARIVYQDSLADRLLYTTFAGGAPGPVEVVNDGARAGDRNHDVGAGAAIALGDDGNPVVAYQDGMDALLQIATRDGGGQWTPEPSSSAARLVGFFNSVAKHGSALYVSTYLHDRAVFPPGELAITPLP